MFSLDEQQVRWYTMQYSNCILACYSTAMTMIYGFVLMWIKYMERYLLCWLLTNRKYVGICAFSNLGVSFLTLYIMMHYDTIATHSPTTQIHYDDNNSLFSADVDENWTYDMVLCRLWPNRQYVHIGPCFNLNVCHCLVYYAPWNYHNWVLVCYQLQWQRHTALH